MMDPSNKNSKLIAETIKGVSSEVIVRLPQNIIMYQHLCNVKKRKYWPSKYEKWDKIVVKLLDSWLMYEDDFFFLIIMVLIAIVC